MRVAVEFQDGRLELDVDDDRLVGAWSGPAAIGPDAFLERVRRSLEQPLDFPPLGRSVVPGDRVVLPVDPAVPALGRVVGSVAEVLQAAGVEAIRAVGTGPLPASGRDDWPDSVAFEAHDPEAADPAGMAYLANTGGGRRVYLHRELTEADVVVPIGLLGFDPIVGYRGPWSTLFPGLSDAETSRSYRGRAASGGATVGERGPALDESAEVSWLLGCLFQIGVMPAASGAAGVIAGAEGPVREAGVRAIDDAWTFRPESRADLVVVGVGCAGVPSGLDDLAGALATATGLVRRGGKIAVLSKVAGPLGPAVGRLAGLDDPIRGARQALKGAEAEPDYLAALRIAEALAWADVYLLSDLDDDAVDDLAMIPLSRPEEARRLVQASPSCIVVSRAERTKAAAEEDD